MPTTLINTSQYPVIIYDLAIDSSKKDPNDDSKYLVPTGTSILTIQQGTSEIALQNLKADNLRAPILLQGRSTLLSSTVSCDALSTAPAITVASNGNTFRKVAINECAQGLEVSGSYNIFSEVAIHKTAATEDQVGTQGAAVPGASNLFMGLQVSNYGVGVSLSGAGNQVKGFPVAEGAADAQKTVSGQWVVPSILHGFTKSSIAADGKIAATPLDDSVGVLFKAAGILEASDVGGVESSALVLANNVIIRQNLALGGTIGAVVIGHNPITDKAFQPILVTRNAFTTKETIVFAENGDKAAYRFLGVEWIAKKIDEKDPTKAKQIIGKLLDQTNESKSVELSIQDWFNSDIYNLQYFISCNVGLATEKLPLTFKNDAGTKEIKEIQVGEKYFICDNSSDGKELSIPIKNGVRFLSNTPTVSVMTDDVTLADLGDVTVFISGASTIAPEGGGLMDDGSNPSPSAGGGQAPSPTGGEGGYSQSDTGGGSDAKIPDNTPMIGEAEAESGGGSAMTGGAMTLGGDAGPSAAGPSAGGCSLIR